MKRVFKHKSEIIGYLGSIVIILGTILPIVTINGVSQSFIVENGKLVLACAVISAILYLFKVGFFSFIPAIGSLLILFIFYNGINEKMTALNNLNAGSAIYGVGFYLIIIGSALLIFSSVINFIDYRKNKKSKMIGNQEIDTTSVIPDIEPNLYDFNNNTEFDTQFKQFGTPVEILTDGSNNVTINETILNDNQNIDLQQNLQTEVINNFTPNQSVAPLDSTSSTEIVNNIDSTEVKPIPISDIFPNNIENQQTNISENVSEPIPEVTVNEENNLNINNEVNIGIPKEEPKFKTCGNCGAIVRQESAICSFCNSKFIDNNM